MSDITAVRHPDYSTSEMKKYRLVYAGGQPFKDEYLVQFSERETSTDFEKRKKISYIPTHAKAAVNDIKNAIHQRMVDVSRSGGTKNYEESVAGHGTGGVDQNGNSMNSYIGRIVLPELLSMGKVGVYVDRNELDSNANLRDNESNTPYVYKYAAEDILSWSVDSAGTLFAVLLRETTFEDTDDLPSGVITQYRYLRLEKTGGVTVRIYNENSELIAEKLLNLSKIPLVIFDIGDSLLKDIADYQIALLNLGSSDMNYAFRSNYPFYVEQFLPHAQLQTRVSDDGTDALSATDKEVKTGVTKGRGYPIGADAPSFIHPSPEPLEVSMAKQEQMKQEIRQLVNLNITNIEPRRASAEAKSYDERGLEAGLSFIGLELEYGERLIARIWMDYMDKSKIEEVTVAYPKRYSLKTESETQAEAKVILDTAAKMPSITYQKQSLKEVAALTMGTKVAIKTLEQINSDIDAANFAIIDRDVLNEDVEQGLVSSETASVTCGYPKGEAKKAQAERAVRAAAVAEAQSKASGKGVLEIENQFKKGNDNKEQ